MPFTDSTTLNASSPMTQSMRCAENAYYIYYEDKLNDNIVQVENLDAVGVLDNLMASDCAVNIMNAFAKHFVHKNHPLNKSHKAHGSTMEIDLNEFRDGTSGSNSRNLLDQMQQ